MIFDQRPVPGPLSGLRGWDQKVKIQLFNNTVMLHIKLKGITDAAHDSKYFGREPLPPLTLGVKSSKFNFLEHNHIKLNRFRNAETWQQNLIFYPHTFSHPHSTSVWGEKVKIQLFENMVM